MEFPFDTSDLLPDRISAVDGYYLLTGRDEELEKHHSWYETHPLWYKSKPDDRIIEIIDALGSASAKAQGLQSPITTAAKLMHSNQRMYIMKDLINEKDRTVIIGMLKVGRKELYLMDENESYHKLKPLCILDFYVHELRQRKGYGYQIFKHMLKKENVHPMHLAIDRPSEMFAAFLKKYYNLSHGIRQGNNFVTYHGFFSQSSEYHHESVSKKRDTLEHSVTESSYDKAEKKRIENERDEQAKGDGGGDNTPAWSPAKRVRGFETFDHIDAKDVECCSSWKVMGIPPPSYMMSSPQK